MPLLEDSRRGTFVGTPLYVSPEMLGDNIAMPASDLWALGCIIYRMHTGEFPFKAPVENLVYEKILTRTLTFPEDMSENTKDIIDKLL